MVALFDRLGAELAVNTTTSDSNFGATLVALSDGGFVAIWYNGITSDFASWDFLGQRFDASGNKVGDEFPVNTTTTGGQHTVSAAALESGGFAVAWTDTSGLGGDPNESIKAQLYDANGAAVGGEFLVNTATTSLQIFPTIAGLAGGGFVIAWQDLSGVGGDASGYGIKAQLFDAAGTKVGSEFVANTTTPGSQLTPQVAALADGGFAISWNHAGHPKVQLFDSAGTKVGSELDILDSNLTDTAPRIVATESGFVVAWAEPGSDYEIKAQIFSAAGTKLGSVFTISDTGDGAPSLWDIRSLPGGGFLVTWSSLDEGDELDVHAQAFDAAGAKVGTEFIVNATTAGTQGANGVAVLDSGDIAVAWTQGTGDAADIKVQLLTASTTPASDIALDTATVSETAIENLPVARLSASGGALNAGYSFEIVSDSTGGAFAVFGDQLFVAENGRLDFETVPTVQVRVRATDGNGLSFEETLNLDVSDAAIEARYTAGDMFQVNTADELFDTAESVTPLTGGGFLVAYTYTASNFTDFGTRGQLYDADGLGVGAWMNFDLPFRVDGSAPTIAALADGGFVAVFDALGDGSNAPVKVQRFDSAGNEVGDEATLDGGEGGSGEPSVTSLANGGFVVTWTYTTLNTGFRTDVRGQVFAADDTPVGSSFAVNTDLAGNQSFNEVAALPGGGFIVVWREYDPDVVDDAGIIQGQVFDAAGAKIGGEFTVPDSANVDGNLSLAVLKSGNLVLGWQEEIDDENDIGAIGFQIIDQTGANVGDPVIVDVGDLEEHHFAAMPDGGFVVTWEREIEGADNQSLVRFFDASGAPVGDAFMMGASSAAQVGVLASGDVVLSWSDFFLNDDGYDTSNVFARIVSEVPKETFASPSQWLDEQPGAAGWHVGDFDGDGKDDVFRYVPGTSGADMFLSTGSGFDHDGSWTGAGSGGAGWHIGDFNGDGKDDVFRYLPGTSGADMFLSDGASFDRVGSWTGAGFGSAGWHVGDFNGDGKDDIFRYLPGTSGADMWLSTGSGFAWAGSWTGAGYGVDGWRIGDFNGDGKDDIFRYLPGESGADMWLSTGTGFAHSGSWTGAGYGDVGWHVGDFNGDGKDDVFRYLAGSSGADVWLSTGNEFAHAGSWTDAWNGTAGWHIGDFTGDGSADLMRVLSSGSEVLI